MIVAVVLAAGAGRRMGRGPKALLRIGGATFLERIVETCVAAGVARVVAVLAESVEAPSSVAVARNPRPERGMISSIRVGLESEAARGAAGALIWPVDCPRVPVAVVRAIVARFEETGAPLVIPRHGGRRGHPAIFAARLFPELLGEVESARDVVRAHESEIVHVDVDAPEVLEDFDRPEDLPPSP